MSCSLRILNNSRNKVDFRIIFDKKGKKYAPGTLAKSAHPTKTKLPPGARKFEWRVHCDTKKWKPLISLNFDPPLPASKKEVVITMEMPNYSQHKEEEEAADKKSTVVNADVSKMIERGPLDLTDDRLKLLVAYLENSKTKFVDGSFDLATQNLTKKEIEWLRPDSIYEPSEVSLFPKNTDEAEKSTKVAERVDIVQGLLGDCWLVTTMAILYAHNPLLLENLFKIWRPDLGLVVVQFFKEGQPVYVLVDDRLPAVGTRLAYCQHNEQGVLWGSLLEKAYAKMMGGYAKIEGGTIPYSISDMTCHATFDVTVKKHHAPPLFLEEWMAHSNLYDRNEIEYLSGASIIAKGQSDELKANGLCVNHAYAILNIVKECPGVTPPTSLVELRNPWGRDKWKGDWSAASKRWEGATGKKLQEALNYDPNDTRGRIWMDLKAFLANFNHIYYAPFFHNTISSHTVASAWTAANSGGCGNAGAVAWAKNPQYMFTKTSATNEGVIYVYLYQDDSLWREVELATYMKKRFHAIGIQIWKCKTKGKRLTGPLVDCQTGLTSGYGTKRQQMVNLARLEPGDYIVVPSTFKQGLFTGFKLGIFSNDPSVKLTPLQTSAPLPKPTGLAQWRQPLANFSFETSATDSVQESTHWIQASPPLPKPKAGQPSPSPSPASAAKKGKKKGKKALPAIAKRPPPKKKKKAKKASGPAKIVVHNTTGKPLAIRIVYKKGKAGGALPSKSKPVTLQCPPGAIALWWCFKGGNIKKPNGKIEFPHPLGAGEKYKVEVKA